MKIILKIEVFSVWVSGWFLKWMLFILINIININVIDLRVFVKIFFFFIFLGGGEGVVGGLGWFVVSFKVRLRGFVVIRILLCLCLGVDEYLLVIFWYGFFFKW